MAPEQSRPITAGPTAAAPPKAYDPMIVVEAMFNGCVTRIGQTFGNPKEYAEGTKTVLPECTKRFQDALDDCEIQILDAKWYLEHKLAENKARREAKAKETSVANTSTKRKHDQVQGLEQAQASDGPAKRTKIDDQQIGKDAPKPASNLTAPAEPPKAGRTTPQPSQPQGGRSTPQPPLSQSNLQSQPMARSASNPQSKREATSSPYSLPAKIKAENSNAPEPTSAPVPPPPPPPPQQPVQPDPQFNIDDFSKPTPQVTPTLTNEEFNFESMFGEPNEENNMDDTENLPIELDDPFGNFINDDSNITVNNSNANTQNQPAVNSMLPGLEAYANQPDDATNPTNAINTNNNTGGMGADNGNAFTNDLDLPDLGGPNIFDDMLNDADFGGDFTGGGEVGGDFTAGGDANISFEDLFGDGS